MRETGTLSRDRVVAGVVAVMLNVALFALLFRQVQWHGRPTPYTPPLQVVWIPTPIQMTPPMEPPPSAAPRPDATQPEPHAPTPSDTGSQTVPASPVSAPEGARPLSAVLLQQVRRAAAAQVEDFSRSPFANRPTQLPGRPADTFRMREPLTAARVVAGIGTLFGGSDYSEDACPELHRQVAQLGLTDSNADRRHALELAQALCQ